MWRTALLASALVSSVGVLTARVDGGGEGGGGDGEGGGGEGDGGGGEGDGGGGDGGGGDGDGGGGEGGGGGGEGHRPHAARQFVCVSVKEQQLPQFGGAASVHRIHVPTKAAFE
jgi:hypothetical protein